MATTERALRGITGIVPTTANLDKLLRRRVQEVAEGLLEELVSRIAQMAQEAGKTRRHKMSLELVEGAITKLTAPKERQDFDFFGVVPNEGVALGALFGGVIEEEIAGLEARDREAAKGRELGETVEVGRQVAEEALGALARGRDLLQSLRHPSLRAGINGHNQVMSSALSRLQSRLGQPGKRGAEGIEEAIQGVLRYLGGGPLLVTDEDQPVLVAVELLIGAAGRLEFLRESVDTLARQLHRRTKAQREAASRPTRPEDANDPSLVHATALHAGRTASLPRAQSRYEAARAEWGTAIRRAKEMVARNLNGAKDPVVLAYIQAAAKHRRGEGPAPTVEGAALQEHIDKMVLLTPPGIKWTDARTRMDSTSEAIAESRKALAEAKKKAKEALPGRVEAWEKAIARIEQGGSADELKRRQEQVQKELDDLLDEVEGAEYALQRWASVSPDRREACVSDYRTRCGQSDKTPFSGIEELDALLCPPKKVKKEASAFGITLGDLNGKPSTPKQKGGKKRKPRRHRRKRS